MDLQMPVMDGISASYAIRKLEHPDAQNIPIIAITANTFAKDLERCRLAGMNEHLSKPLNIRQLIKHPLKIQEMKKVKKSKKSLYDISIIQGLCRYYLFMIASIDLMHALLRPDSSRDATPQMVVPAGEHTLSFNTPGCSPVSS